MKNSKIFFLIAFLALFGLLLFYVIKEIPFSRKTPVEKVVEDGWKERTVGIYDRTKKTSILNLDHLQQVSVKLNSASGNNDFQSMLDGISPNDPVLITIEAQASGGDDVLQNTIEGHYDLTIKALCDALKSQNNVCYVRWNPEMEVPVKLYPWQYQSPEVYIKAFRHFALRCKASSSRIQIVWGTAGYPGADEYWPGSQAVDLISITLNGESESQTSAYPRENEMEKLIRRKILRMRFMNKPVFVLDAGAKADFSLSTQLASAIKQIEKEDSTIYSFIDTRAEGQVYDRGALSKPLMGVYDPKNLLTSSPSVRAEHLFIDLENCRDGTFLKLFNEVVARKHDVIVTFEPWKDKRYNESMVLNNTINGVYDEQFRVLYKIISTAKQTVYLRFLHEMEIPIHRYPWQSQDPVLYIKAFRYFMNFNNGKPENVKRVWGPAGDRGSMEWWPGGDVVDYVSIAIYGLPDKNITDPNQQELFSTIYKRKSHRMRFSGKPIFITEFGVTGPAEFQRKWLKDAAAVIKSHREIFGISYFNLADNPKVWGDIPTPVWSISKKTFSHFAESLSPGADE